MEQQTVTYQPPTLTDLGDYTELTLGHGIVGPQDFPGVPFRVFP